MNERIRELAKQAGFIGTNLHNTVIGTTQETALQNFAELIVQECSKLLTETDFNNINGSPNAVAEIAADLLKDHFGVE